MKRIILVVNYSRIKIKEKVQFNLRYKKNVLLRFNVKFCIILF